MTIAPWLPEIFVNPWFQLALATPVQFWAGSIFYIGAWKALRHKATDMNTLIAVGTSAAYFYSVATIFFPEFFMAAGLGMDGEMLPMYFDTSAAIITLILLGPVPRGPCPQPHLRRDPPAHQPRPAHGARHPRRRRARPGRGRRPRRRPRAGPARRDDRRRRRRHRGRLGRRREHDHRREPAGRQARSRTSSSAARSTRPGTLTFRATRIGARHRPREDHPARVRGPGLARPDPAPRGHRHRATSCPRSWPSRPSRSWSGSRSGRSPRSTSRCSTRSPC